MVEIPVAAELWSSRMLPEGLLERWLVADGALVRDGEPVAEVSIEGALHRLHAPATGRLAACARVNDVIEPGSVIGEIHPVSESASKTA